MTTIVIIRFITLLLLVVLFVNQYRAKGIKNDLSILYGILIVMQTVLLIFR